MKNCLFNNTRQSKFIPINILILLFSILFRGASAFSQGMGMKNHSSPESKQTLPDQLSEIRSKLFQLEIALEKKHQGKSEVTRDTANKMGMKKMGPMGKTKPQGMSGGPMQKSPKMAKPRDAMNPQPKLRGMGMMGKEMMGRMNKKSSALLPSSLPGFPGVSHIYHMGSTDFFLDHSGHISLTTQQKTTLNQIKEQTTLENLTMDRKIQELEQAHWVLTSSDQPGLKKIGEKIREIERRKGDMRLAFIQAVGKAATVLSSEQLEVLKGMKDHSI